MLNNLSKTHINPSLTHWSPVSVFHFRLLKPCLSKINGSNFPNGFYTILCIRDPTLDPYSVFHFRWPKSMDNVSLWHIIQSCINMTLYILTTALKACSDAPFWCEALAPLNIIFFCFFNISSNKIWGIKYFIVSVIYVYHYYLNFILPFKG